MVSPGRRERLASLVSALTRRDTATHLLAISSTLEDLVAFRLWKDCQSDEMHRKSPNIHRLIQHSHLGSGLDLCIPSSGLHGRTPLRWMLGRFLAPGHISSPRSFWMPLFLLSRASIRHSNSCSRVPRVRATQKPRIMGLGLNPGVASPTILEYPVTLCFGIDVMRLCLRSVKGCIVGLQKFAHTLTLVTKVLPVFYLSLNGQYALLSPVGKTRPPEPPPRTFKVIDPLSCDNAIHDCSDK